MAKGKKNKQKEQTEDNVAGEADKDQVIPKTEGEELQETPQAPTEESLQSESNNNDQKNEEASEDTRTEQSTLIETQSNDAEGQHITETPIATYEQPAEEQTNKELERVKVDGENNDGIENKKKDEDNEEVSSESINKSENIVTEVKPEHTKVEQITIKEVETQPIEEPELQLKTDHPEQPTVTEQNINTSQIQPQTLEQEVQPYIEIKQSTESIEQENVGAEEEKVSILKSYHSSEGDQEKIDPEIQETENIKEIPAAHNSQTFVEPEIPKTNQNYNGKNSEMFQERQIGWEKFQEEDVEPILKSPEPVFTPLPFVPELKPPVKESLNYTNNLPIIEKERTLENQESKVLKNKESDSEKPNKEIESVSTIKKLVISSFAAGLCVGACVYGKTDRKLAVGACIVSFMAAFFVQK